MTSLDQQAMTTLRDVLALHKSGALGGQTMPEDALLDVVEKLDLLDVLTLGMSLNYQRNSYALWRAVAATYASEDTRWVFMPERVRDSTETELKAALAVYRVALQPNRHPAIWRAVATGVCMYSSNGRTSGLLEYCSFDVACLKELLQVSAKKTFPYLSGPKIFNYWLYVVSEYCQVELQNRGLITVAPDTHILQSTVALGLCDASVLKGTSADRDRVASAWDAFLAESELSPIDVHTPLWLWSRAGFPSGLASESEQT